MIPTRGSDSTLEPAYFAKMPEKGSLLTEQEIRDLEAISSNPMNHNMIYREKCLTDFYTIDEIAEMSRTGEFDDIYVGDRIKLGEIKIPNYPVYIDSDLTVNEINSTIICAGVDWFPEEIVPTHHSIWYFSFSPFSSQYCHSSTTTDGYAKSYIHTTLLPYIEPYLNEKLNNHMLDMKWWLSSSVEANLTPRIKTLSGATYTKTATTCKLKIPSEIDMFGAQIISSCYEDQEGNLNQLPCFSLCPFCVHNYRGDMWLSSVVSQSHAASIPESREQVMPAPVQELKNINPFFVLG